MKRRVLGGIAGLIYAFGYGFFAVMFTGGGHVNLIWLILFFAAYFAGLYFVLAGILVVDLRPLWTKITLGSLLSLNWFMTTYFIVSSWDTFTLDMTKSWNLEPFGLVVTSVLYFLPPTTPSIVLVKKMIDEVEIQKYL